MKDAILSHLSPDYPWADRFQYFPTLDSTNDRLKLLARQGAAHGTVLAADRQTAGHGRRGRSFQSPEGMGVYLSILLRPDCTPMELMHLTCAAGVAMCDAVEAAAGFRPGIKWTNDLVLGKRKLVGILTELSVQAESGEVDYAVVGIGTNCNHREADFPPELRDRAVSLLQETGERVDRAAYASALIRRLAQASGALLTGKADWLARYAANCVTLGKDVKLVRGGETRLAHADGIDENAALLVTFDDGTREAVSSGEVSVRGMYGYTD